MLLTGMQRQRSMMANGNVRIIKGLVGFLIKIFIF
jgi:hypothetical protein